jgi:Cd2+/Zn2+-exporting ATPase
MMTDYVNDFMALGFTESEAKVYLALLTTHPANGYQLSKKIGIPRSIVYEALGRLNLRGAVLKTGEERSTVYRPIPPSILLDRLEQDYAQLTRGLQEHLSDIFLVENEELLWTINGAGLVYSYALQMVMESRDEILIVIDDSSLEQLREPINKVCKDKKVQVKVLLTGSGMLDCAHIVRHPTLESELQDILHMLLLVVDNQECLIANTKFEVEATITKNPKLVFIARQFIWMELFSQRIYEQLGAELIERLEFEDLRIFENITGKRIL